MSEEKDIVELGRSLTKLLDSPGLDIPFAAHISEAMTDEITRLRGEVERLRSGLQNIASMTRTAATEEVDAWELRQVARDTLSNLQRE